MLKKLFSLSYALLYVTFKMSHKVGSIREVLEKVSRII
jgi:hypothetical protein